MTNKQAPNPTDTALAVLGGAKTLAAQAEHMLTSKVDPSLMTVFAAAAALASAASALIAYGYVLRSQTGGRA